MSNANFDDSGSPNRKFLLEFKPLAESNYNLSKVTSHLIPSGVEAHSRKMAAKSSNQGAPKPPLSSLINVHDFQLAAEKSFTPKAWAFVTSAATDLHTKRRNGSTYSSITLRPRVLRDVGTVDTRCAMLGKATRLPIFCSPTSMATTIHPDGEKELARGLKETGVPMCVSSSASFPLADIVSEMRGRAGEGAGGGDPPVFLQLYVDRNRANTEKLMKNAREQGVSGLFLTVDSALPGKREADERIRSDESLASAISGIKARNDAKGGALGRIMGGFIDPALSWDDIPWLRKHLPGVPIVLKGIQTSMDAIRAMEAGVDGIVVSNHGGRNLDTAPATIMVLIELRRNCPEVFDRMEVYIDGGITRGTDIFKALCLGARAVGLGRGFLFALNYGTEGVRKLVGILQDELETTMKLCGVTSLDELHPGLVNTLAVDYLVPGPEDHLHPRDRRRGSKL
ncbi:hypothetical protein jhhlp_002526 [Lomentospora prolificans]|uniref:L-lactate dehydrogenase (cytochrome) n=1 Tax=Lomentospora prolificans TaxID=41688 RepID=A0A2N3NEA9_9PEZI|nr:hypothetical protein jhhlp_002526 [Lomentospora prolificans]